MDPRRIDPATRITLALLSRLFNWLDALIVVQPKTLIPASVVTYQGGTWIAVNPVIGTAPGVVFSQWTQIAAPGEQGEQSLLKMSSTYHNRPHMALGPGVPDPPRSVPAPL